MDKKLDGIIARYHLSKKYQYPDHVLMEMIKHLNEKIGEFEKRVIELEKEKKCSFDLSRHTPGYYPGYETIR